MQKWRLTMRLWNRVRQLRRDLFAAQARSRQCEDRSAQVAKRAKELEAEIKRMKAAYEAEGTRLRQLVLESSSKAAAEHFKAFKWGHDYKVMELHLAAATGERDSYLHRMRELTAKVGELEKELESERQRNASSHPAGKT